eukprot:CAMPEP_0172833360 /NCGR_PEP_ID=MMETSP1075-20121228/24312_1 /TAXON_ID=2916 /ORGANISM="Ceratium fusus, Strain PA161109" /LENGTH=30 /DNA_ID= /DNA_START= /DNA_END= /DNA_ORIENTATION=
MADRRQEASAAQAHTSFYGQREHPKSASQR